MTRINKKRSPAKSTSAQNQTGKKFESLEQKALHHLEHHQYKDAIYCFKQLLKQQPDNASYFQNILTAYQWRCLQLAEKKMYKEACVIWENFQLLILQNQTFDSSTDSLEHNNSSPHRGDYLQWLLKSGYISKALEYYQKHESEISDKPYYSELQNQLAAQLLVASQQDIKLLAEENPLKCHLAFAKQALNAYCEQHTEALQLALKKIPFRSAFKDFSLILKALVLLHQDQDQSPSSLTVAESLSVAEQINNLFEKITDNSAFYPFAQQLLKLKASDTELIESLIAAKPQSILLITEYLGWDEDQLNAWTKAHKLFTDPKQNKHEQLKWMLTTPITKNDPKKEAILAKIALIYSISDPQELARYRHRFTLDNKEKIRLQALEDEKDDPEDAVQQWELFLDKCDNNIEKSLVCTRIADIISRHSDYDYEHSCEDYLNRSIEYNPQDKSNYLRLFELLNKNLSQHNSKSYKAQKQKSHQLLVTKALQYFPEDRDILIIAIKDCQRRKVYKKATIIAGKLLKIDPINPFARTMLISSHLAQGRKNVLQKQYHLAEQQLNSALKIDPKSAQCCFFKAVLALAQQTKQQPITEIKAILKQAFELQDNPLLSKVILSTELQIMGLMNQSATTLSLGLKGINQTSRAVDIIFTELFEQLKSYQLEGITEYYQAVLKSESLFKNLSKKIDTSERRIKVATLLIHYQFFSLAKWFICYDKKLFNHQPLLQYYYIVAESEDQPENVNVLQFSHLEKAYEEAQSNGEQQTAALILKLLIKVENILYPPHPFGSNFYEEEDFDEGLLPIPEDFINLMDNLMDNLSPTEQKQLLEIAEQGLGGKRKR